MPASRHKILSVVFGGIWNKLNRTKRMSLDTISLETPLKRCLSTFDIALLGIGHMVGAGIYVLTGTVAKDLAGPGIIFSFALAGIASTLAALCYAEFGTRIPKAGSAYVYTYISIGEFWAFVIGWNIVLEHMIGAASVARAWSGYVDSLTDGQISGFTKQFVPELHEQLFSKHPDLLSFFICILYSLILAIGVKSSAVINSILTSVNIGVISLIIMVGFSYGKLENWTSPSGGFLPYGVSGVISGAATCFYAYVGFDCIATSGEEAKDPAKSIPVATFVAMAVVTLVYVLVSMALTLMIPYVDIKADAALPDAFSSGNLHWLRYVIVIGAVCGMTTSLLGSLFALPRCLYAMAEDGLIFNLFAKVNRRTQLPVMNMIISTFLSALIALFFDLEKLVEFMSIGTLLAYTIVSASVIILRYKPALSSNSESSSDESSVNVRLFKIIIIFTLMLVFWFKSQNLICLWNVFVAYSHASNETGNENTAGTLRRNFYWLRPFVGDCKPGSAVSSSVLVFILISGLLCGNIYNMFKTNGWFGCVYLAICILALISCIVIIVAHHQNTVDLKFKVPLVPYLPALSILCNIELMANLNLLTWIRFIVWMAIGLILYFLYGMHHSKLNDPTCTYSVLLTPSGEQQVKWGATVTRIKAKRPSVTTPTDDDTQPIIDNEHRNQ